MWVDGRELGSHRGSYLPFELRAHLAAGTHTVVVRIDWRNPAQQSREGFHRTWFNWGGLDGEVDVRPIGESELSEPTLQTTLTPDTPAAAGATVRVSVHGPQLWTRAHACAGRLARARRPDGPAELPRDRRSAHGEAATDDRRRDGAGAGAVVAERARACTRCR